MGKIARYPPFSGKNVRFGHLWLEKIYFGYFRVFILSGNTTSAKRKSLSEKRCLG
jgi:hypothetical protein